MLNTKLKLMLGLAALAAATALAQTQTAAPAGATAAPPAVASTPAKTQAELSREEWQRLQTEYGQWLQGNKESRALVFLGRRRAGAQ